MECGPWKVLKKINVCNFLCGACDIVLFYRHIFICSGFKGYRTLQCSCLKTQNLSVDLI